MKKTIYYLSPFVLIPAALLLLAVLSAVLPDKRIMPVLLYGVLILVPAGIGLFSPSRHTFDGVIAALTLLSFLMFMFIVNFADAGETYARFDLAHTLRVLSRTEYLILYALTAISPLATSYKPFRIYRKHGVNEK